MKKVSIEQKNILSWIVDKIQGLINLDPFRVKIADLLEKEYTAGLEKVELEFNMNFVPNDKDLKFLTDYVQNNMNFATDELGNTLRQEISRSMLNKEKTTQLKQRIKEVFDEKKYFNRLKTILRTESLRAGNTGALEGAKQTGLNVKKYLDVVVDKNTSPICIEANRKYGTKEKAIPLESEFIISGKKFKVRVQTPPNHPNCRTTLRFTRL